MEMASEDKVARGSNLLSADVKSFVEDIARELHFEDFEILVEEQPFTGDNYVAEITRVKISPLKNSGQKSVDLILKTAPHLTAPREFIPLAKFFEREIFVYTTVLPVLDSLQEASGFSGDERISFAKFYKGTTEEFKEVVIMKDLSSDGYVLHDKRIPFDMEHAEIVIRKMASLHATSFVLKERNGELFTKLSSNIAQRMNYGDRLMDILQLKIDEILLGDEDASHKVKVKSFSARIKEELNSLLDARLSEPYNVICHGDCWNNNMLFKYKDGKVDDVILIDWQIVRLASPATDLTYMICMSMDQDFMETHLQYLLDLYYESLSLAITKMGCNVEKCYPKVIFNEHLRRQMIFGFIMALCIIPTVLSEPEYARTIDDIVKDLDNSVYRTIINNRAADRLKGLIDYFVRHDII